MTLTYGEALAAISERGRFGVRLGLGRTRALLRGLGEPERAVRGALVAGTNGKGSVVALAGAVLRAAGHRVGEAPKPHLVSYRERAVVDGCPIDRSSFARLAGEILAVADRVGRRLGPPTEFEILTALAFRWFAEMDVAVALVEVGLGGRLDATHAWDGGVAVITNVDLDHTDQLGPTIPAIAREKAAIIVRGDRAVTGATGEGLEVVRRRARHLGVPLVEAGPAPLLDHDRDGIRVALPRLGETAVGLRGRHQAANVAVADATLDALEAAGIAAAPESARRAGYAAARWPGRLELVSVPAPGGRTREVLLDGAHNPAGAATLARALDDLRPHLAPGPLTLVMAMVSDKDVEGTIRALSAAQELAGARVVCTQVGGTRALDAATLAAHWRAHVPGLPISVAPEPAVALERALAVGDGPIVVAGSLYLVGAIRGRLVDEPELRDEEG